MSTLFQALQGLDALGKDPPARPPLPATPPRPAGPPPRAWTAEQETVLASPPRRLDVVALAGTGKTAVLGEYARRRPRAKWRYLTFNRALADQAPRELPRNARASTFHAWAFPRYGAPLGPKLGRRFDAAAVRRAVGWAEFPGWESAVAALREWRRGYLASAEDLPRLAQLPPEAWGWLGARPGVLDAVGGPAGLEAAIEAFWRATIDPREAGVDAPVDVAVKLMALARAPWWADGLLIDEAQDMTPCLAASLAAQDVPVLAVGDPSQTLYAWRRAGGVWPAAPDRLALTGSFRFGAPVAEAANRVLARLGAAERLEGLASDSTLAVADAPLSPGTTWVARTQAGAWQGVMAALEAGLAPGWVGQGTLARLQGVLDLAQGRPPRDPWLAGLESVDALAVAAEASGALEWKAAARLVQRLGAAPIERALAALAHPDQATVRLTTVHQAKGQTFDRVRLGDDLRWDSTDPEELRVGYVALTRSAHLEISLQAWSVFAAQGAAPTPTNDWDGDSGF